MNNPERYEISEASDERFYARVPWIIFEMELGHMAGYYYTLLRKIASDNGSCSMSQETLAKKVGCSDRSIRDMNVFLSQPFEALDGKPLIRITKRKGLDGRDLPSLIQIEPIWVENIVKKDKKIEIPKTPYSKKSDTIQNPRIKESSGRGNLVPGGRGNSVPGEGEPSSDKEDNIYISYSISNTLNIKDNVLDNVSESQEIQDPEMKKLSQELRAHLDSIGAPEVPKEIEEIEKTMTFSSGKGDIEKAQEVRGIKSKFPLKKEQVPVFEKIKALKLECDDDMIIVLIRQNWAKGVQFFEDCLHHVNYLLASGKAAIKSRIAFFRDCLKSNQALITEQSLKNMRAAKKYAESQKWTEVKITEKYVQCTRTGKEVSTNISFPEFQRFVKELWNYQHSHA